MQILMKRSTLLLPLLLLAFSHSAPISAKNGPEAKHDSVTAVMEQYAKALEAAQKAESAHTNALDILHKAQEALKNDTTNAAKKKAVEAAKVQADSLQQEAKAPQAEADRLKQQLLDRLHAAPAGLPWWLAALLGVLLVGVSLIGGMRVANTLAKKRKARKAKANVDYARSTQLVHEGKQDAGLLMSVKAFLDYDTNKLALEKASVKETAGSRKRQGKSAPGRTFLLQTVRVPADKAGLDRFSTQLLAYYGRAINPKSLGNLLQKGFTEEGTERRVYHLPLWASTDEQNDYSQSVVKEEKRYYFQPFPTSVPDQPEVDAAPFEPLDQLLQQLQSAPQEAAAEVTATLQEPNAPAQPAESADNAENAGNSSHTVEWTIENGTHDALSQQSTAEPTIETAANEAAPAAQTAAPAAPREPGIFVPQATLEAIAQARQGEKSTLLALLQQASQASQGLSTQNDLARQLSDEQNRTRQLTADLEQLRNGNATLDKALKANEQQLQKATAEQQKLTEANQRLTTDKKGLQDKVDALRTEVDNCRKAQQSYRSVIDFWPELQPMAKQLLQLLDNSRQIELHAQAMTAYDEGSDDDRNYYLVRIARKMQEQLSAAADIIGPLRADLPLLAQHQMVRTDGWIYTQLHTVKAAERAATLGQLIERALVQVVSATVIAADEYAYWLPEMIGVTDRVTREFTPLRDALLASANACGLKVGHVQPFTLINPTNTENIAFWPDDSHRWQPGTVIEVFSLAVNGSKAQVKATRP